MSSCLNYCHQGQISADALCKQTIFLDFTIHDRIVSESILVGASAEGALDDAAEAPFVEPPAGVIGPLRVKGVPRGQEK